jgi:hypothetical protein
MAVKTSAVTTLVLGEAITLPETTALNGSTDTINITAGNAERLLVILNNTTAATKKFTIKAGESPPALRKGLGDLVVTMLEKTQQIVCIETARHANADGTVSLSFEAASTGFVSVVKLPKGA